MSIRMTKEFGMVLGLRCAYRNHLAKEKDSARFVQGHSLGFIIGLECEDEHKLREFIRNKSAWMDQYIEEAFSQVIIVSTEDPYANVIAILETEGLADLRWMVGVGLREFAEMIKKDFSEVLHDQTKGEIWITTVQVVEHAANQQGLA